MRKEFPLVAGVFFLVLFLVVIGSFLAVAKSFPYSVALILAAGPVTFSIIGAFLLRQSGELSEKSFLDLMKASYKYLPSVRRKRPD